MDRDTSNSLGHCNSLLRLSNIEEGNQRESLVRCQSNDAPIVTVGIYIYIQTPPLFSRTKVQKRFR